MIDIITDFEKKIEEPTTICPELVYLNKEKSIKAEAGKENISYVSGKDADGKPVEDTDVYIRTKRLS